MDTTGLLLRKADPKREQAAKFRDDTGNFCQEFPAKRLTLYREPTSLVVRETKLPPAKPSLENSVLFEQVDTIDTRVPICAVRGFSAIQFFE